MGVRGVEVVLELVRRDVGGFVVEAVVRAQGAAAPVAERGGNRWAALKLGQRAGGVLPLRRPDVGGLWS